MDKITNILWYSNPPHSMSGYGVSTRNILPRLIKRGYSVGCQNNWGFDGSPIDVEGIVYYGQGSGLSEYECVQNYLRNNYHVLVTLYDIFVFDTLKSLVKEHRIPWVAAGMLDHRSLYPWMRDKLDAATWIVPPSDYGANQLKEAGYTNYTKIPLGVDTKIFKPIIGEQLTKQQCRKDMGFPENTDVVIGIFKMNKGQRTGYPYILEAVKMFKESNPDLNIWLYLHCSLDQPDGYPLSKLLDLFGLTDITRTADAWTYSQGYSTLQMAKIYNTMDVVLNTSLSEGFGLPIIESLACGVPVVAGAYSAMEELVKPVCSELLVPSVAGHWEPFPVEYWIPDKYKIAEALEKAIARDPRKDREILPKHAKQYDWELIVDMWVELFKMLPEHMDARCLNIPKPSPELLERAVPKEVVV